MESFFLQHSVIRDRDPDEVERHVNSDSEASDDEEITDRVYSVADPTGPWTQRSVDGETWGKPSRGYRSGKARDFASANTGPKGVINDYKTYKQYQKQERLRKEADRQAVLKRITQGVSVPYTPSTSDINDQYICDDTSDNEYDESDLLDDATLTQYANMRIKQMQEVAHSQKNYGELEYITPDRFVKLTGNNESITSMLVHLYHPDNYACGLLNSQLEKLARKLVHVKFTAMVAREADASIETVDLPIILVIRGQHQEVIVDVARLLNGEFTYDRVDSFVNELLR